MAQPKQIVKYWAKPVLGVQDLKRVVFEKWASANGYELISEEDDSKFSGGKAFGLALLFLPLALFGHSKKLKCTYEKIS